MIWNITINNIILNKNKMKSLTFYVQVYNNNNNKYPSVYICGF